MSWRKLTILFFLIAFALGGAGLGASDGSPEETAPEQVEAPPQVDQPKELPAEASSVEPSTTPAPGDEIPREGPVSVYVIPVRDQIGQALMFVFRRGMKEAIELEADVLLLDMDTPGGRLDVTLEMMEMLDRFPGRTITYINNEAVSAGAFISAATNEIYFAPRGLIGAAAPVSGAGQEIPETMRQKLMSYLGARIRAFTEDVPYRAEVLMAMVDAEYVLVIDGEEISGKGELLSLTAREAMREFGDPPGPLLGAGIAESLESLLETKYGVGNYTITEFIPTWSEELARWLTAISPLLLGIGLLCIFFEFKTPGFGFIGIAGFLLLSLVFLGHHLAGLAGMEPLLLFLLGVLLVMLEVLFLPGLIIPALIGLLLMLGSLIWGMADIWPGQAFELTPEMFLRPLVNLIAGLVIAVLGALALAKFIPGSWFWSKMILAYGNTGDSQHAGPGTAVPVGLGIAAGKPGIGDEGMATTDLYPSGEVEVGGKRYQARIDHGSAERGDRVQVSGHLDFGLLVTRKSR